jgi:protein-L-isoaspartate(D-aspartate) O-methyltransferase
MIAVKRITVVLALMGLAAVVEFTIGAGADDETTYRSRRMRMVSVQIEKRGIKDAAVLEAMRTVPRHRFVPDELRESAYEDRPLPIGESQTISQPLVVAEMTAAIGPRKGMKVLEVGTGSGYQAAVLAACVGEVYTIEVIPKLSKRAETVLKDLSVKNVHLRVADGYDGWPEHAPFDAIVLTAAPPRKIPQPLIDQLRVGGRIVAPVGRDVQELVVITRTETGTVREVLDAVRFVPMTGKAESDR